MTHTHHLAGKVVLITGAARGIGAETARTLSRRGARIALVGLEPDLLAARCDELGSGEHAWFTADVTEQAETDRAVADAAEHFGRIDVVVANAGVASYGTVRQIDPEVFARTIDINLTGVFRTVHAALPHLIDRRGYALIVASLASFAPLAGMAAYDASKSGVEAFGLALRQEVAHLGVDVGLCHPAWIDTDLVREAERDLPTFGRNRTTLPWPANTTTSVQECARFIADGIARRADRIYVPRSVLVANLTRAIVSSPVAFRLMRRKLAVVIPRLEREVAGLGRQFGAHVPAGSEAEEMDNAKSVR